MTRRFRTLALVLVGLSLLVRAEAQSPSPSAGPESSELLTLTKKIDEQNLKIDLLSQQILRLQQAIEHPKAMGLDHTIPTATAVSSPIPADANTHVVARGETLTSIARMHKVTIDELQKLNHIENDRKLQIGQTLVIPGAASAAGAPSPAAASPSPSASVPNE
ncbi:MAG: LysM domain-containing protein [Spartobacteria bacterium]